METLKYDEHGLICAVAQDAIHGDIRMVAWMNAEALKHTLETGKATFYSRSRQALWTKGETSGHTLGVVVVYRGRIIAERYAPGWGIHTQYRTWSTAKSIASALIGVLGAAMGIALGIMIARIGLSMLGADLGAGYFRGLAADLDVHLGEIAVFAMLVAFSQLATILVNLVYLVYDPAWFKSVCQIGLGAISLAVSLSQNAPGQRYHPAVIAQAERENQLVILRW